MTSWDSNQVVWGIIKRKLLQEHLNYLSAGAASPADKAATTHAHTHFLNSNLEISRSCWQYVVSKLTTLDRNLTATDWVNALLNCKSTRRGVTLGLSLVKKEHTSIMTCRTLVTPPHVVLPCTHTHLLDLYLCQDQNKSQDSGNLMSYPSCTTFHNLLKL